MSLFEAATVAAFSLGTTTASTGLTFGSTTPTVGFSLGAGDSSKASPTSKFQIGFLWLVI